MDKKYFIMLVNTPWAGPSAKLVKGPDLQVNDGIGLDKPKEKFVIKLTVDPKASDYKDFPPCDLHGPTRNLLFSEKLIELLENCGVDNVQYFDADVTYEPTGEKLDYKVANVIGVLSGLDLNSSDVITSRMGNILEIEKMALDESKFLGHKLFRLKESIMHLVVHKSIKDAIDNAGLTGVLFITDDEYEPGML